jgi:protein TonB
VYAALANHKPTAVERGSTTVTFEIGGGGVLGDVRVGQSSGNARLDQTALQMVRDAAPFPPPPSGASFYTIQIDFQ